MYRRIIRPILFRLRAESVHGFALRMLRFFGATRAGKWLLSRLYRYESPLLEREVFGITFSNPVGVAAGYDTDARHFRALGAMGFGFVEAGTITPRPQPGNLKPRVFRLPKDRALVSRTGHPNGGMDRALENLRHRKTSCRTVVGASIAANTLSQSENIEQEYLKLFRNLFQYVDYFVVNVTGPNSAALQNKEAINGILSGLFDFRRGQSDYRPVLLKISPDWSRELVDDVVDILIDTPLDGLVVAGGTSSREGLASGARTLDQCGGGNLGGAPLLERTLELIAYTGAKMQWRYPIIASGGIMSPEDAQSMLDAGASLVQVYTGLVYNGPALAKSICKHLDAVARTRFEGVAPEK